MCGFLIRITQKKQKQKQKKKNPWIYLIRGLWHIDVFSRQIYLPNAK